ncbi:pyridoxal phosphate-dependent decarboxylase family protein [Dermabacter hominis]|uniref:pyridoxal phosphate-dependent decarboxylase family protein n=1 Tax=Dermabacter hominis TaxID=36740 RepID=UPI00313A3129|nr:aminotransferase class V-fold PLP-dependent enzyme [Dermabacter hominis]
MSTNEQKNELQQGAGERRNENSAAKAAKKNHQGSPDSGAIDTGGSASTTSTAYATQRPSRMLSSVWGDEQHAVEAAQKWAREHTALAHDPKATARSAAELDEAVKALAGDMITEEGIGADRALEIYENILIPATRAADDPMNLAYIPGAPTRAAVAFDNVVSAANVFGGVWEAGAGAIWAENQVLRWLMDLLGWPEGSAGAFVSGGTSGNLSALATAREKAREEWASSGVFIDGRPTTGFKVACASSAHSSIRSAARLLDVEVVTVPVDERGHLSGPNLARALDENPGVFAVVASGGTTNAGIVDDIRSVVEVAHARGVWVHIDGAYGGAALAAPSARPRFDGIEQADSFIVDPHKWLFAPYDCCALVYRDPSPAYRAHSQHAEYLDSIVRSDANPSDSRGPPFASHARPPAVVLAAHARHGEVLRGDRKVPLHFTRGASRHRRYRAPRDGDRARTQRSRVPPPGLDRRAVSRVVAAHGPRRRDPVHPHEAQRRNGTATCVREPRYGSGPRDRGFARHDGLTPLSARVRERKALEFGERRFIGITRCPSPGNAAQHRLSLARRGPILVIGAHMRKHMSARLERGKRGIAPQIRCAIEVVGNAFGEACELSVRGNLSPLPPHHAERLRSYPFGMPLPREVPSAVGKDFRAISRNERFIRTPEREACDRDRRPGVEAHVHGVSARGVFRNSSKRRLHLFSHARD